MKRLLFLATPYVVWMALMALLPTTASAYAWRGAATATALVAVALVWRPRPTLSKKGFLFGLLGGFIVLLVWVAPELFVDLAAAASSSPYAPSVCGWPLTLAKLFCSAFVISAAEELFFRKGLLEFAGFGWMLVLFGVEHARFDLGGALALVFIAEGVFAGLVYGLLAKKCGLASAILAHALTNFLLGLDVILCGKWFYW